MKNPNVSLPVSPHDDLASSSHEDLHYSSCHDHLHSSSQETTPRLVNYKASLEEGSLLIGYVVVQLPNHVWLFAAPWTAAHQAFLSLTISWSLPKFMPLHQWCHPAISSFDTLFSCARPFPASGTFPMSELFPWDDQNTGVSALASVLPMTVQGWFDLFAVQGTLRRLLHHHSLKASVLQHSALFTVQLSQPYVTTGKTIALTRPLLAK